MSPARRAFESSHGRKPVVSSTRTLESPRRGRLRAGKTEWGLPTGHTYSNLLVHVIFSTKNRAALITPDLRPRLHEYLAGIAKHELGHAVEIGGTFDHVHALLSLRTDVSLAEAMRKWKSLSSGWVHKTFPNHQAFAWQSGYAAFSVSQSAVDDVRAYIVRQEEHHHRVTFEEELRAFLDRHGIEYDPDHMLD